MSDNYFVGNVSILGNVTHFKLILFQILKGDLPLHGKSIHKHLTIVSLHSNQFSSSIPASIDESDSLEELLLFNNELIGK